MLDWFQLNSTNLPNYTNLIQNRKNTNENHSELKAVSVSVSVDVNGS